MSEAEPGLLNLGTEPKIAIGQRALIVRTPAGNVMWDCITYVDDESVAELRAIGGLAAIAISCGKAAGSRASASAAGMYGVQTTGKPVKIISKVAHNKPAHYYEIQIDTKKNEPQILNGRGEGVDIPPGKKGDEAIDKHGIEWVEQPHGTRVTIELQAKFVRGRGSVDEYLEQTAIANPHVALHYSRPRRRQARLSAVGRQAAAGAEGDQAASVRRRAGPAGRDAARTTRLDRCRSF